MEVTMEENLEIEFKILINEKIYQQIINDYPNAKTYQQTNYYLLHPKLSELKYSLRIREKDNQYELTLKQPQTNSNLETNLVIDQETKNKIMNHELINNDIFDILKPFQLNSTMFQTDYFLTTLRKEIKTSMGIVCIDYNQYNNHIDYELEYEVSDFQQGKQAFLDFIEQYHLSYKKNCPSKTVRLINSLQ